MDSLLHYILRGNTERVQDWVADQVNLFYAH